jgi:putative ABC transport system ATP-binding protein
MAQSKKNRSNGRALVELRNVVKTYKTGAGQVTVLHDISFRIQEGEFVSIVGPSGSGKSTMLNVITGIDRPTRGEVTVAGQPLHELSENQLALWRGENVGVIFQFFQLLPTLTLLENVVLPMDLRPGRRSTRDARRERRRRALSLLKLVGIAEHAGKLPHALSGGQQQRAAIARSLANDPPLIVGDEPTGNLDTGTADQVFRIFEDLAAQGKTVIWVTHDRALSERTGRVLRLLDGRLHRDERNGATTRGATSRVWPRSPEATALSADQRSFHERRVAQSLA